MAKNTAKAQEAEAPARSESIDVVGQNALGLAAAYSGLYHLFDARVEKWDVTPDGLVAHGFSVDAEYNPERIVADINKKDRRAPLFPAILSIVNPDVPPPPFASNLDITTYMVNFWKGSMGENSSRTPDYVRTAADKYKSRMGTKVRKGPKVRTINVKNIRELNAERLVATGLKREDIEYLIQISQNALENGNSATETAPATNESTPETVNA